MAGFATNTLPKLERSEVRCELVFGDASMGREPPSRQRRVALACIDVHVIISIFSFAVDDVLPVKRVVFVEWIVRPKAISVDCQRLLLAVRQQESNRRFICGFRRVNVRLSSATISEDEHRWLVLVIRSTAARRQATRARPTVALAAFLSRRHIQFVDLNRAFELWLRRVQRPKKALDAPIHRLVGNCEFSVQLPNARIQPDVRVDREIPPLEWDCRILEDCASLVVKRAVAILTAIPLKHSIAAVPNHGFGTAARAIDAVTPANLCQQIRGPTLRDEHIDWEHCSSGDASASPLPAVTSSYCSSLPTILYRRAYTISSPDTVDTFEITVAVGDENEVGSWLAERPVGEVITIEGPYGDIAYRGGAEVLVLAGGPGIGPGVGIGERAITDQDVVIIYRDDAFIHRERLTELEAAGATVTYLDPAEPIDRELIEEHLAKTVYVFGFEAFVQDATDAIDAAGGDPSSAQVEGFGPE